MAMVSDPVGRDLCGVDGRWAPLVHLVVDLLGAEAVGVDVFGALRG